MKQVAYKCDVCGSTINQNSCHKANIFYWDMKEKRERSKTFHFCKKCFGERFSDLLNVKVVNPPTLKQLNLIEVMEEFLQIRFEGETKGQASKFIEDHLEEFRKATKKEDLTKKGY